MKVCYFTATGNSLYVAERVGGTPLSIPRLMKEKELIIEDDAVGVVCPVYAGEMPMMVRSFLRKAKIRADYVFFVYTYGMTASLAAAQAIAAAKEHGLNLDYVQTIKMVDNYLPGFEAKEQIAGAGKKDIEGQIGKVCKDIADRKKNVSAVGPFRKIGMAAVHAGMAGKILRGDAAQSYLINDDCVHCGICAKVCPADNITVSEDDVVFSDHCEVCYACLHNCPQNALHLKNEKSAARFRNEHVSLKEIIKANE